MKFYFLFFVSAVFLGACSSLKQKPASENPNIILILADDMGYGDAGCYNPESKIPTPNIDRIASEGIKFTDAHSPASLCTPTRYGLLTGRYCWRTRLKKWVILGYDETPLIEKSRTTIGTILKNQGYNTACIGKWHLGMNWATKDGYVIKNDSDQWMNNPVFTENEQHVDFTKPVTGGPTELGFSYFFGTLGCSTSDPPYCFIENDHVAGIPSGLNPARYNGLPGFVSGAWCDGFTVEYVDTVFTDRAIRFIEKHVKENKKDPFFLCLALSSPHNPFLPPDFTKGKSQAGPRGDLVMVVDWSVGKIEELLGRLGIERNTLVIVTSDNGAVPGANGHQSNGGLRGVKSQIWEGGHRVPFIAKWPGKIQPGTESQETISLTDLFASFARLVSYDMKDFEGEDSFDVLPAIFGNKQSGSETRARIFHSGGGLFSVRKGSWLLIEGTKGSGAVNMIINNDSMKMTGQLYNLISDPFEKDDLWDTEPSVRDSLHAILRKIRESAGSNERFIDQ